MVTVREETRKGPWTEQEDLQLVAIFRIFRAKFAATTGVVSANRFVFPLNLHAGLNRTGKSCRLRWVNYLHPGLKHGRMTPHEERLILELHARWGNRWSRIARRLPGRTDNEIKNYWRTHMRKKAQERKRNMSPSSSSSSLTYQSGYPDTPSIVATEGQELHGGITSILKGTPPDMDGYPMDQIWMEIEAPEAPSVTGFDVEKLQDHACSSLTGPLPPPAAWDYYYPEACWKMDDEIKMAPQFGYSEGAGPCF